MDGAGLAFLVAALLCAIGLAWLPGRELDRAFMVMGYVFCTTAAFALAKFVRDNELAPGDSPLWRFVVWGGFFVAMALTGWGLVQMEISPTYRAFLGAGCSSSPAASRSPRRCATRTNTRSSRKRIGRFAPRANAADPMAGRSPSTLESP